MEIFQSTLQNVHQLIVPIRIRGHKEKPRFEHKILGIADDSFNHLAVIEVHPHPQTRNNRRMFMKMKGSVLEISIKRLHKEHGLGILGRDLLDRLRVNKPKPNRFKGILGVTAQKLLYRSKLTSLRKTPNRMIFIPNNDPMGLPVPIGNLTPYA
jgi:hypothetical protein